MARSAVRSGCRRQARAAGGTWHATKGRHLGALFARRYAEMLRPWRRL